MRKIIKNMRHSLKMRGRTHPAYINQIIAMTGDNNPMRNPEVAKRNSLANRGKKKPMSSIKNIGNTHFLGKKHSEATKLKISESEKKTKALIKLLKGGENEKDNINIIN